MSTIFDCTLLFFFLPNDNDLTHEFLTAHVSLEQMQNAAEKFKLIVIVVGRNWDHRNEINLSNMIWNSQENSMHDFETLKWMQVKLEMNSPFVIHGRKAISHQAIYEKKSASECSIENKKKNWIDYLIPLTERIKTTNSLWISLLNCFLLQKNSTKCYPVRRKIYQKKNSSVILLGKGSTSNAELACK